MNVYLFCMQNSNINGIYSCYHGSIIILRIRLLFSLLSLGVEFTFTEYCQVDELIMYATD